MANVRDWVRYPPKQPLTSFKAILADWNDKFAEGRFLNYKRDHVVDYVMEARWVEEAIERAVVSKTKDGKMHNHQVKVRMSCRIKYGRTILELYEGNPVKHVRNFADLFQLCEEAKCWGIGDMTVFDVAMRLSYWFKVKVDQLYLHAGCLEGWLEIDRLTWNKGKAYWQGFKAIPPMAWPKEFRHLPGDEFEDICCTYRHFLKEM